ncbi:MAG: PPK2 family polyphosphate kinase [Bacteroidota bacterium]
MPKLKNTDTTAPKSADKDKIKEKTAELVAELGELQELLYAENKHAVLIVLQGMDASGKDSTVKSVFEAVNPMGCQVKSFKKPTEEEYSHDFLWRIHRNLPPKGMIQIFNRSQYEDFLVPYAHDLLDKKPLMSRLDHINNFEEMLHDAGTIILKFFLHISKEEQEQRFKERLDTPSKNWKYKAADLDERKLWDKYADAYETIFDKCSPGHSPWLTVPADNKWYRNYIISEAIVERLRDLKMKYPKNTGAE